MEMHSKENVLKAIRFEGPDFIPMRFSVNAACWNNYDQEALKDLIESHKTLFPNYKRPSGRVEPNYILNARAGAPYRDPWGCVWETAEDGITGSVHEHPLADWKDFKSYKAPDPGRTDGTYPVDWKGLSEGVRKAKEEGRLVHLGLPHGHSFLRLQDIRGYESVIFDMMDGSPEFLKLLGMVEEFNYGYTMRCLELGPDIMGYAEDLGMQSGPMLSPELFRKFIKPLYQRCMKPARDQGCAVHMHSDGDIRSLVDDLIDGGVEALNLQDLVNGLDWIEGRLAGKLCIELDIDRQRVTRFGTPSEIDALVREEVERLSTPQGGLMMVYGLYPGVPLENAKAVMDAMERYCRHHRRS